MSESQSRYSIIERLTNTELELLNSKLQVENEITQAENNVKYAEKELSTLKEELKRAVETQMKNKERELDVAKDNLSMLQTSKASKLKGIEDKLAVIKKGVESVQEVSKSAAVEAAK